jgi:3-deoxy-7-phosphoheptulonate synthase
MALTCESQNTTNPSIPHGYIQGIEHKLISRIVFATNDLHKSESAALLDRVYATGCNAFDCAADYGGGKCEELLGAWIRQRKINHEDVFVVTKGSCGGYENDWPRRLKESIQNSLKRLSLDVVDLFMLQQDDPSVPIGQIVDTMNSFINCGFTKTWGVSNWQLHRLDAAIEYAMATQQTAPVCDSLQMGLATPSRPVSPGSTHMDVDRESWYTVSKGVSVFASEPLAQGFLLGNADLHQQDSDEHRAQNLEEIYSTPQNIERRDRAAQMAAEKGVALRDIAVAFLLAKPVGPFVLIGSSSAEEWSPNVQASALSLSSADVMWLESGVATAHKERAFHCLDSEYSERSAKRTKHQHFPTPLGLHEALPVTAQVAETVEQGRASLLALADGDDDRLMVLIGPCSVHDPKAAIEYAKWLKPLADQYCNELIVVMRVYFEKPRTTVGWKGLMSDPDLDGGCDMAKGIKLARALLMDVSEMGLLAGTEFLAPNTCDYISDLVSYGAIGARTTESQCHREMASRLGMPVGFKNGTSGDVQVAADAITAAKAPGKFLGSDLDGLPAVLETEGNPGSHLILRGGKTGTNFDAESVAAAHAIMKQAARIVVDCSHGNSSKKHKNQPIVAADIASQIRAGNQSIMGVMIESNLVEGNQGLKPGKTDVSTLMYGQSVTDACIDLADSKAVLENLAEAVQARRCL